MDIVVLGAGHIGGTLAKKWAKAGHQIHVGARDPRKPEVQDLVRSLGANMSASSIAEAISQGEIVLFAVPGPAMDETISSNASALDGKIVIDAANNLKASVPHSRATFETQAPHARYVRAFNNYGWENYENPMFDNTPADLFYCGQDGEPHTLMDRLISDVGLNPVYLGGPDQVDVVDSILKLWFTLAAGRKMGRHLALKVLTR